MALDVAPWNQRFSIERRRSVRAAASGGVQQLSMIVGRQAGVVVVERSGQGRVPVRRGVALASKLLAEREERSTLRRDDENATRTERAGELLDPCEADGFIQVREHGVCVDDAEGGRGQGRWWRGGNLLEVPVAEQPLAQLEHVRGHVNTPDVVIPAIPEKKPNDPAPATAEIEHPTAGPQIDAGALRGVLDDTPEGVRLCESVLAGRSDRGRLKVGGRKSRDAVSRL